MQLGHGRALERCPGCAGKTFCFGARLSGGLPGSGHLPASHRGRRGAIHSPPVGRLSSRGSHRRPRIESDRDGGTLVFPEEQED